MRVTVPIVCSLFALAVSACGDDKVGQADTAAPTEADTTVAADTFVPFEDTTSSPTTDAGATTEDGTSPTDASEEVDTGPNCDSPPYPFFCPCENVSQCQSNYCVAVDEPDVAQRCTKTCVDSCPEGWDCVDSGGTDPVFICKPPINTLCQPCETHSDCLKVNARCVEFEDGKFCGSDCQDDANSCPTNYECGEILNGVGRIEFYQCVPTSGSCQCPDGTDYANDPENCGFCKNACSYSGGVPGCANEECYLKDCQPGFVDLDEEDSTGCEYACTKTSDDDWPDATCNGSDCDQNCDGIDGEWDRAVFVSASGTANGSGSPVDPVKTISAGIGIAQQSGKDHVYVAGGTYNEQVTMVVGISLFGGYSNDGKWVRRISQYPTTITSSSGTTSIRTVIADGIDGARTSLDGFVVTSGTNANPSGSSYAIWVRNSTASLEIVNVAAVGGSGGAGGAGTPGASGSDGVAGGNVTESPDSDDECNEESLYGSHGGTAGSNQCTSGANAGAGAGGAGGCLDDSFFDDDHVAAKKGGDSPGGAAGGPAPGEGSNGNNGSDGSPGNNGANGTAGTGNGTVDGSGFWQPSHGSDGTSGNNGVGGGGGSGGGGTCCSVNQGQWGGGGGGGGSGGCGGAKGTSGRGGGASFGVFIFNASPRITRSALGHQSGGNGGAGGLGGAKGVGKSGGSGIGGFEGAGSGARGGKGGDGGRGGHGGGGAGGVAYGLYLAGSSDPVCSELSFAPAGSGGTGGIGGVGGDGSGNKGSDGTFDDKNKSSGSCP